jgi:EAL domain-containing protein (putative c-di-GMP-specific phosphodiesterase class I)
MSKWVLDAATREACHWYALGNRPLSVNVNVPAAHFADATFVDLVRRQLDKYSLMPESLNLELVESTLVENQTATIRVLEQLRKIGCYTAIDDFGTGYSSLSYLQLLPVSSLKIDRKFIRGVDTNPRDAAIASTIVAMAHSLGLTVVAEGVETLAQMEFLQAQNCDLAQGFLFSQPLPAEQWRRYFVDHERRLTPDVAETEPRSVVASSLDQTKQVV